MESLENELIKATNYEKEGKNEDALETFNDVFNILIENASQFALKETGSLTDKDELRKIYPILLQYSESYLSRDMMASKVLNQMGTLFEKMGDFENAAQKFSEAIKYIPLDSDYADPRENLDRLMLLAQNQNSILDEEE